jgi:hypothetical protein
MTASVIQAPFAPRAPAYAATSATSATMISTGVLKFTTQPDLSYTAGTRVRVTSVVSGSWMEGVTQSYIHDIYGTAELIVEVSSAFGSGIYDSWNINLAGQPGTLPMLPGIPSNAVIGESHTGDAATFSLRTLGGSIPTPIFPVRVLFPSAVSKIIAGVVETTVPSAVTLGTVNSVPFRLWFLLLKDGDTVRIGIINCRGVGDSIIGFPPNGILPTTVFGSASGRVYVGAGITPTAPCPFVVLGFADWDNGLGAVGTWNLSPNRIVMYGIGIKLPGQVIQELRSATGDKVYANSQILASDAIPQSSDGSLVLAKAITPTSKMSMLDITSQLIVSPASADSLVMIATRSDQSNALAATWSYNTILSMHLWTRSLANTLNPVNIGIRFGSHTGIYWTVNGAANLRYFGGTFNSFLVVRELMA